MAWIEYEGKHFAEEQCDRSLLPNPDMLLFACVQARAGNMIPCPDVGALPLHFCGTAEPGVHWSKVKFHPFILTRAENVCNEAVSALMVDSQLLN